MSHQTTKFSEKAKALRLRNRLTLRDFCTRFNLDPSNWSKVERGINPPPSDNYLLEQMADFFELSEAEHSDFIDAAALQRKSLPPDMTDEDILHGALPAFFRAARGHKLSNEDFEHLKQEILKLHRPD